MKFFRSLTLLCGLLACKCAYSQQVAPTDAQNAMVTRVDDTFKKYPEEKLSVHTAQNAYAVRQTVWYKIYAMAYGKPSALSKIVYLRLINNKGNTIAANKHMLINGAANGDLTLPDSVHTGWYQLQAYTAWMLNGANSEIYNRKIFIFNPRQKIDNETMAAVKSGYKVTFYPEGGELIDGFTNKIAFKVINADGAPVSVSGEVMVNGKPANVKFTTIHDGMGRFDLETYAADKYTIKLTYPDKSIGVMPLPAVFKTGVGLAVNTAGDFVSVSLKSTAKPGGTYMIFAMQDDGTSTTYPLKLQKGINEVRFKKDDFARGIVRFTVFDNLALPMAERIVFVDNAKKVTIAAGKDSLNMSPKAGNTMSFKIDGAAPGTPVSVAVTDAGVDDAATSNVVSDLMLSSELKGHINNPAYYFSDNSDSLRRQLDLVMLTNGWRHFTWEKINKPDPNQMQYQPEDRQFAIGKVDNYDPVKQAKLKLMVINPDSSKYFLSVEPDSLGRFIIDDRNLVGSAQIFYDAANKKNRPQAVKMTFINSIITDVTASADTVAEQIAAAVAVPKPLADNLSALQSAADKYKGTLLREVKVKTVRKQEDAPIVKDHVKNLTPDRAFDLDMTEVKSIPPVDLLHYIIGRFPGLDIVEINGVVRFNYAGKSTFKDPAPFDTSPSPQPTFVNPPIFYVDEARYEYEDIKNISMYDIALIRFVPPPVWFAPLNGGISGAIMIYLKNQKDNIRLAGPGRKFYSYVINGYSLQRQFAEPDYTDPKLLAQPDYRSTLYWNPNLLPDPNGEIKVKFYNSDQAKHYRVTINAMDNDGKLGSYAIVK